MAKTFRLPKEEPILDIVSYGGGSPRSASGRLTPDQVEKIRRTVQRIPEVMVKVLPRTSNDLKAAGKHLDYISRNGALELESDSGVGATDEGGMALLADWDVDIDDMRRQSPLASTRGKNPPKLVHKLMFSMPPGTPPDKVLAAVRNFAREEFALQHRYAFVLHTDEDHPHVHLVMKAVSEQGVRLNIKKATLRHWRSEFASHLRLLGVAANATERAVRGQDRKAMQDGIFRASQRGDSTYLRDRAEAIANELLKGNIRAGSGKQALLETRRQVMQGWEELARRLVAEEHRGLARDVQRFVDSMPPPQTEREWLAKQLRHGVSVNRSTTMQLSLTSGGQTSR